MDGSYGHPARHAQSPLTPQTPSTSAYQVNVSRTKTRKWVEAKVQNYDGDDWGADEFEESDSEPAPAPPPQQAPPQVPSVLRTYSGTELPSSRAVTFTPNPPSGLSGIPSLRVQTQSQPAVAPVSQTPPIGVTSPVVSDLSIRSSSEHITSEHLVSPQSSGASRSRDVAGLDSNLSLAAVTQPPSQFQQPAPSSHDVSRSTSLERESRPTPPPAVADSLKSPQSALPSVYAGDKAQPFGRPSEIYPQAGEDQDKKSSAVANNVHVSDENSRFAAPPKPLSQEDRRDTWERDDDSVSHQSDVEDQPHSPIKPGVASEEMGLKRVSTSPKLPDFTRISTFESDFFSTPLDDFSKETPILEHEAGSTHSIGLKAQPIIESERRSATSTPATDSPAISKDDLKDTARLEPSRPALSPSQNREVVPTSAEQQDVPITANSRTSIIEPEEDDSAEAPGGAPLQSPGLQQGGLRPGKGFPSVPPLRTPSPHEPRNAVPVPESESTKITPTEPLQPRKAGEPAVDLDPRPFQREPTFNTVTSSPMKDSPLKESDVLSDEIMRSLSPGGATPGELRLADNAQLLSPAGRNARESSYTLSDYDSYWADETDRSGSVDKRRISAPASPGSPSNAEAAPIPQSSTGGPKSTPLTSPETQQTFEGILSQQSQPSPQQPQQAPPQQPKARRRFSWEAEEDISKPQEGQPPADGSATPTLRLVAPPEPQAAPSMTDLSNRSRSHSPASQVSQALEPAPGPGVVLPQVSGTTGTSPAQETSSPPEVSSPASGSVPSDSGPPTTREQARLSLADEKILAEQSPTNLVTGTPPPENHPALLSPALSTSPASQQVSSPATPVKIATIREIMSLGSVTERITKYNETRRILASKDSGLDNWLTTLSTQQPEHGFTASASYALGSQPPTQSGNAASQAGSQPPTQQPYYQQYLNASTPSAATTQSGRSRLGGLSVPSQMSGSAFGHSSNQLGTKSKEFMHSAGKMGKGLLSKGKSKLRGSGDKDDPNSPVHPAPSKSDRRTSWRFSWEPKSREDEPAPHTNEEIATSKPTPPPQLPNPSPISPLNPPLGSDSAFPWAVPPKAPDSESLTVRQSGGEHDGWDVSLPGDGLHVGGHGPTDRGKKLLTHDEKLNKHVNDITPDDWVMVSHHSDGGHPEMAVPDPTHSSQKAPEPTVAGDGGAGLQSQTSQPQAQTNSDVPKRASSFIGLPPIRRSSTFGIASKVRRAAERFSLEDDDDDDDLPGEDTLDVNVPPSPASEDGPPMPPTEGPPIEPRNEDRNASVHDERGTEAATAQHEPIQNRQIQQPPNQPGQIQARDPNQQQYAGNSVPPNMQQFPPNMPPQMMMHPFHKLPPAGPWKLEESHLAEPLHLTKKRSGTDFSQQVMYHGYEKELGLEFPPAPMPPPPQQQQQQQHIPGRLRSDVPPSSAQRYPELFSHPPGQDPRQWARGPPHPQQFQSRISREDLMMPRAQYNEYAVPGVGPPADERGRQKRNSGILKDIGTRIARATSRERRSSLADPRPPSINQRGDEFSDTSGAAEDLPERRKKRSSFLGFSSRRSSMDQGPRRWDSMSSQQSQPDLAASIAQPPSRDRKRSLLGVTPQQSSQSELMRSSSSSLAPESNNGVGFDDRGSTTTQKKRLSGLTGLFSRSKQERGTTNAPPLQPSKPGYSGQSASQADLVPPSRGRAGTAGSFGAMRTESPADPSGRRSRQGSSSGLISGILGHRSGSKTRDQPLAHNFQAQQLQQQQLQHQFTHSQLGTPVLHPGGHVHAIPPQAVPPVPLEVSRQRAASMGFPRTPPPPLSMRQVSEPLSPHLRPSPLGLETSMAHGDSQSNLDAGDSSIQNTPVAQQRRLSSFEDFATPPEQVSGSEVDAGSSKLRDTGLEQKLATLEGAESRDAARSEPEILRPLTVSPEVSVGSDGTVEEQGPAQAQQDVPKKRGDKDENAAKLPPVDDKLAESSQAHGALIHAPSPRPFPSVISLNDQLESHAQREASIVQPASDSMLTSTEASPQVAQSVLSEGPLPPVPQQPLPVETNKPQEQHGPGSRILSQGQQLPDPTPQQGYSTQGRQVAPSAAAEEPLHRHKPTVSASNISVTSTPVFKPGEFETPRNVVPLPLGPQVQSTDVTSHKEGQGSMWKGLKNRVSEQMGQKSQHQQSPSRAGMGDKAKAGGLLGAFKRSSKQQEATQGPMNAQPAQSTWQQAPPPIQQPYFQSQQPRVGQPQAPLVNPPPPNHYPPSPRQPPNMLRAQTMPPGPAQSGDVHPYGHYSQAEPQYAQVPIPRGYTAVHGEGLSIPSPYNKYGQPAQYSQVSSPPQPYAAQQWHGQQHPVSPGQFYRHASSFPQQMIQSQHTGLSSSGQVSHFSGGSDVSVGQHSRALSSASQSAHLSQQDILQPQTNQNNSSESQQRAGDGGQGLGIIVAAQQQKATSETSGRSGGLLESSGTTSENPRSPSRSPQISVRGDEESKESGGQQKQASSLGLDAARAQLLGGDGVRDATLKVPQNKTGESDRPSVVSRMTLDESDRDAGAAVSSKSTAAAELEDTEEVRKRAIRLESQEEKILYEPEDEPKMSATSYPGQEWNPFGEPEYGDWREE